MELQQQTVVITIREGDPLCVSVDRLTKDSPVFRYLILELCQYEVELEDFAPDTVTLFLTLLDDKEVAGEIEEFHYRELHKLSVVFEVEWLTKHCRAWLANKIDDMDSEIVYENQLYLFEESRYILNKWNINKFIDLFVLKFAAIDNSPFITRYMADLGTLGCKQLDLMLKVGASNTKVYLEVILQNLTNKTSLEKNTKHLLQTLNLALCFEQNEELYHQMFEKLSAMPELTLEDSKLLLHLSTETGKRVFLRKTRTSKTNTLFDWKDWKELVNSCKTLGNLARLLKHGTINNIFALVELMMIVIARDTPDPGKSEAFVRLLDSYTCVADQGVVTKASSQYIDMIISTVRLSYLEEQKVGAIELLEMIRGSEKLCSRSETLHLVIDRATYGKQDRKYPFEFRHPGLSCCSKPGKCGFIIKLEIQKSDNFKIELSTDEKDYENTGLHFHEIFRPDDIFMYVVGSATTKDGTRVKIPVRWRRWWFPEVGDTDSEVEEYCVGYCVKDYLVARQY